jgi:mRNA-degrading endonuclease YafQ of YafQ-DinJ toxin-antitoxin module
MAELKFVTFTQLFWDTLEKHRNHARYQDMRAKIAYCVQRKRENRQFSNNSDAAFVGSNATLAGIWHCKLSVNPDVVMFYTMGGDNLNLAMVGSHHDYPFQGKASARAPVLAKKVHGAIERGHVPSPMWRTIRWSTPDDILANHELVETTIDELAAIMDVLELELYDAPIYRQIFGGELIEQDEIVISEWLTKTDAALEAIRQAQTAVRAIQRSPNPNKIESFGLIAAR